MADKRKIKISVLCTIALTIILLLMTIAFTIISVRSVRKIGNFAVEIDKDNVQDISTNLFLEITRRTAKEYSHYFKDAEDTADIIAEEVGKNSLSDYMIKNTSKYSRVLRPRPGSDFFVSPKGKNFTAFYWGEAKNGKVPSKVDIAVSALSRITPMLNGFLKSGIAYYYSIWIHSRDRFMFMVPESDLYYNEMKNRDDFKKYFDIFNILTTASKSGDSSKSFWLKPYMDMTGTTVISVFSPAYNKNKEIVAAVGVDLNLDRILNTLLSSRLLLNSSDISAPPDQCEENHNIFHGFLFLMDKNTSIIAFPQNQAKLFSLPENYSHLKKSSEFIKTKMLDTSNPKLRDAIYRIQNTGYGIEPLDLGGRKYFIAYSKLESTGWILSFVVSEEFLIAPAKKTRSKMNSTELEAINHGIIISLVFLAISILVSLAFFKKYLFNRIEKMIFKIRKMARGDFNIKFREEGIAEIAELATNFNYLRKELTKYMVNLEDEIKARQQIEAEIKVAAEVQRSMLPLVDEEFIRDEFELAARLSSAKEASGDFYDFFFIEENKLALIIADVAGKGISAAFFMGMVKTLLKTACTNETTDPGKALNMVNRIISHDNSTMMFVTIFVGYYELDTGKLVYANAGHHDAICISKDGIYRTFGRTRGIALGVTDMVKYENSKTFIGDNDKIVLYTDGVVEAINPDEEEYGEDRFRAILMQNRYLHCEQLAEKIIRDVRAFERDKRFDDVTVLILEKKAFVSDANNNESETEESS